MMKQMKRALAFLLCLLMLCAALPELSARAEEIELIPVDEEEIIAGEPGDEEIAVIEEEFEEQHILNPNGEAPYVTTNPSSVTKTAGYTAKFTVKATGSSLKYQWYYRTSSSGSWQKTSLTGNTTATLSVKAKTTRNGYQYRCKVSNTYGYMYSKAATLTVKSGSKPTISSQPSSVTATAGATAKFTVKASNATKYQWYYRTSSSGSWHKATLSGNATATLSVYAKSTRNGYQYRCKVSNSNSYVYTSAVKLTVKSGAKPTITTQPKTVTKYQDYTAKFTVKASNATKYQWYYRTSSSGSWKKSTLSSATSATLSVKATSSRNGYQYRCKVSNSNGYVYSNTVTLKVNLTKYRALLVGEVHFPSSTENRNKANVELMEEMLDSVKGPKGGSYASLCFFDLGHDDLVDAISSTFSDADGNDVSLFYIATHGVVDVSSGIYAGELCLTSGDGYYQWMTLSELATCLKAVPGKVIVFLASCGSGAAVLSNNGEISFVADANELGDIDALFNSAVVQAFADADEILPAEDGAPVADTGEFRDSKFYVMTAAAHMESGWGIEPYYNYFTLYITKGAGSGKPADANGNGTITLDELYDYVYRNVYAEGPFYDSETGTYVYQHVQVYPENSSYRLFK